MKPNNETLLSEPLPVLIFGDMYFLNPMCDRINDYKYIYHVEFTREEP